MPNNNEKRRPLRWLPVRAVFTLVILISEIVRPLYRPLVGWISTFAFVVRFSDFVAALPRFMILVLFVVPFAIAEPLKIFALILIARGAFVPGLVIIVVAYLVSFVLVERIFHAGREKLLTYGWLKWIFDRIEPVRAAFAETRKTIVASVRRWLGFVG